MVNKSLLHTPDGVRDIYGSECYKKIELQKRIGTVFLQYGYQRIQTPTFEFFDIFNQERGTVPSKEMYKFFDRENHTLVLRPDITPSIARCVAKYYGKEEKPIRLCYEGNTFLNQGNYQGKLREATQAGAELIQEDSDYGDAEVIAMTIDACLAAGLLEFQVEIGHVDFFKGLMEQCHLLKEEEEKIRLFIENKNFLSLETYLQSLSIPKEIKEVLLQFETLYGGVEVLEKALGFAKEERSIKAIRRLMKVNELLRVYGVDHYVSYDLGMLNLYNYYTGITFQGYTYGTGEPIVKGGRYNELLKQFGKDAPSVGFAFRIDELLAALERQNLKIPVIPDVTLLLYGESEVASAIRLGKELRGKGQKVELLCVKKREELQSYIAYGKQQNKEKILWIEKNGEIKVC